ASVPEVGAGHWLRGGVEPPGAELTCSLAECGAGALRAAGPYRAGMDPATAARPSRRRRAAPRTRDVGIAVDRVTTVAERRRSHRALHADRPVRDAGDDAEHVARRAGSTPRWAAAALGARSSTAVAEKVPHVR